MEALMSRRLVSKEVCERLQVTYNWLKEARKTPGYGPPCYRIGRRYQYPVDEMEKWLETKRID